MATLTLSTGLTVLTIRRAPATPSIHQIAQERHMRSLPTYLRGGRI